MKKLSRTGLASKQQAHEWLTVDGDLPVELADAFAPHFFFVVYRVRRVVLDGSLHRVPVVVRSSLERAEAMAQSMNEAIALRGTADVESVEIVTEPASSTYRVQVVDLPEPWSVGTFHVDVCTFAIAQQVAALIRERVPLSVGFTITIDEVAACPAGLAPREPGSARRDLSRRSKRSQARCNESAPAPVDHPLLTAARRVAGRRAKGKRFAQSRPNAPSVATT